MERVVVGWLLALAGAHTGAALRLGFEALTVGDDEHRQYVESVWWVVPASLVVAAAVVLWRNARLLGGATALAVTALGAVAAEALPADYRAPLMPTSAWAHGLVLVVPPLVVGAVLLRQAVMPPSTMNSAPDA